MITLGKEQTKTDGQFFKHWLSYLFLQVFKQLLTRVTKCMPSPDTGVFWLYLLF